MKVPNKVSNKVPKNTPEAKNAVSVSALNYLFVEPSAKGNSDKQTVAPYSNPGTETTASEISPELFSEAIERDFRRYPHSLEVSL